MKDTRFIELINLYIDRQISPEETSELEAEIRANARHRQVYQQYCKMHRATKLVYESFRANAEQPAGNRIQPSSIARFERRQRNRWYYALGGLAAAACVAFVLVRSGSIGHTPAQTLAVSADKAPVLAATVVAPAAEQRVASAQPSFSKLTHEQPDYAAVLASMRQDEQRAYLLGQTVRGTSLFDDGVFDGKQVLPLNARRATQTKKSDSRNAEFTAFQFQR